MNSRKEDVGDAEDDAMIIGFSPDRLDWSKIETSKVIVLHLGCMITLNRILKRLKISIEKKKVIQHI